MHFDSLIVLCGILFRFTNITKTAPWNCNNETYAGAPLEVITSKDEMFVMVLEQFSLQIILNQGEFVSQTTHLTFAAKLSGEQIMTAALSGNDELYMMTGSNRLVKVNAMLILPTEYFTTPVC